jgi:hypothetical protein
VPIVVLAAAASLFVARTPFAAGTDAGLSPEDIARRAAVAAHVGPNAVTVGQIEDRLSPIPRYQLRTFGRTASDVVHNYFDRIVLRDELLVLGAKDRHLETDVGVEQNLDRMISSATLRALIEQVGPASSIPMDEVQKYYDANRARFDTGDRVTIWRILCATRDEAVQVIGAAQKDPSVPSFNKLARDHSTDKATNLRGGNLGFVGDDGVSSEPGLKVDPAVVAAAKGVKDGELVSVPVPEGAGFAVVWRRGTSAGVHRTVDDAKGQIQEILIKEKRDLAEKALMAKLKADKLTEIHPDILASIEVSVDDGKIRQRRGNIPSSNP